MYIHSFRLIAPRKLLEAQLFNQQYQNYEDIPNVQDRLRWCRHHMGLMQKEVADLIGITRGHYIDFEVGYVDHYPKEIVDKLAELYQVPVDDLLDDYNVGEKYSVWLTLDPSFPSEQYTFNWHIECGRKLGTSSRLDIDITEDMIRERCAIYCEVKSTKTWHRYNGYDQQFAVVFQVLPPDE